jgi:TonB family protein
MAENSPAIAQPAADAATPAVVANTNSNIPADATVKPASITPDDSAPSAKPIPSSVTTPGPAQRTSVRDVASAPRLATTGQDSTLQASRPPSHFVYPDYLDVHARGVVSLTASLDADGAVRSVRVISGNRVLAAAAVKAVRQWRYRPYLKDGQPVATETNIVISFISDDAISMTYPPSVNNQ